MNLQDLKDHLLPYWSELDGLVDEVIRPKVSARQFTFSDACRLKAKGLFYVYNRVEELDGQYEELVKELVKVGDLSLFDKVSEPDEYHLFPFFEAVEFEHLLFQGKACLDCMAKAIGAVYERSPPDNLKTLRNVLRRSADPKALEVLKTMEFAKRLEGLTLDPEQPGKKSLRDLIAHRRRADIYFHVRRNSSGEFVVSDGALLGRYHELPRLRTHWIEGLAAKIFVETRGIVENCLKAQFSP